MRGGGRRSRSSSNNSNDNRNSTSPLEALPDGVLRLTLRMLDRDSLSAMFCVSKARQADVLHEIAVRLAALLAVADRCKDALTDDDNRRVDFAINAPGAFVVVEADNVQLTSSHLSTLCPRMWLGDEVVNNYFTMLDRRCEGDRSLKRCHFFNSFFISKLLEDGNYNFEGVRNWTRQSDLFSCRLVMALVNVGNQHWCLVVVDFEAKTIRYYDSMGGRGNNYLAAVRQYLDDEHQDKKGRAFDFDDWKLVPTTDNDNTPRQSNSFDCGVFATFCAHYLAYGVHPNITQEHTSHLRRRMMIDILNKRLV